MIHNILLYGGSLAIISMFAVVVGVFEGYVSKAQARTDEELCQDAANRRKSFCARHRGSEGERAKAARRKWRC